MNTERDQDIFSVAAYGEYETLLDMVREDPSLAGRTDRFGSTPLIEGIDLIFLGLACQYGRTKTVEILLQLHVDVNHQDIGGRNALHYAAGGGFLDIVKMLLPSISNIDCQDSMKKTALHWASYNGYEEVATYLVRNHANELIEDEDGNPASKWLIPFVKKGKKQEVDPNQTFAMDYSMN